MVYIGRSYIIFSDYFFNLNNLNKFMKKKILRAITLIAGIMLSCMVANAQAPANAPDVMLQGFHWDSYGDGEMDKTYSRTKWSDLMNQVDEIAESFDLVWLPPSAKQEGGGGTGYHPIQWCNQNSSWGSSSELKQLISALNERGTRAIADIVINHKAGSGWTSFYAEDFGSYGGSSQFTSAHICRDDEASNGHGNPTGANDAGYETLNCDGVSASGAYCAARDLDHSSSYVRDAIKAYLKWMKGEMGYDGWRYDLVKGYLGKYTNEYNNAAGAYMSVGEYWDGSYDAVVNWINATNKNSMAFDFPGKYSINNFGGSNLDALVNGYGTWTGISGAEEYSRYAVTFIDNHDTFRDGYNKYNGDWTKANAFILAGPGIPCVFWPHWEKCKDDIKAMIRARKACGIHSQSKAGVVKKGSYIEGTTEGTNGTLKMFIGSGWSQPAGYQLACSGDGWAYYTSVSVPTGPTITMSPSSGYVGQGGKVTLTATGDNVSIYYTNNGTTPSASSAKYTGPISITVDGTKIRAIAIDGNGNRSSEVSGTFYTEEPEGLEVKFTAPSAWSSCYLYVWDADGNSVVGEWPGKLLSGSGNQYTYTITETAERPLNVIFNNGAKSQTVDLTTANGTCWDASGASSTEEKITPEVCDIPDGPYTFTVTVVANENPLGSGNMNIYAWDSDGNSITEAWPGTTMTKDNEGNWEYTFTNLATAANIVINNGEDGNENQTADITGIYKNSCIEILSSLNSDGKHNTAFGSCGKTAVNETEAVNVTVYPNPATDAVYVLADKQISKITVSNLAGGIVMKTGDSQVNIGGLAPSLYFLEISFEDGSKTVEKVLKK